MPSRSTPRRRSAGRHRRTCSCVAISASGESEETIAAVDRYRGPLAGRRPDRRAPLDDRDARRRRRSPLDAGEERGGVACRSFQHTALILRALEARLGGRPADMPSLCERVADASADLLDRRSTWLPEVAAALDGPDGVFLLAPAERLASAEQGALMIREGPRRLAVGVRDRRLEPRRRLPDEDPRLPGAPVRRLTLGRRSARLAGEARLDVRGRRAPTFQVLAPSFATRATTTPRSPHSPRSSSRSCLPRRGGSANQHGRAA